MVTVALAWRVLCALTAHKPAHGHGPDHGGKAEKMNLARTKLQGRLLLFWVGCVCPTGVLYAPTGTMQPQTAKMAADWPVWSRGCLL